MEKQFIADLKTGDAVCSAFVVTEKSLVPFSQPNRAGESYLRLQLGDVTGTIKAVAWERGAEMAAIFQVGDVICVRGEVGNYRGPQLVVFAVEVLPPNTIDRRLFQKAAPRSRDDMVLELESHLASITNPFLEKLMQSFLENQAFFTRYVEAPAARSVHHNYVGGLLEHSLEVATLCRHFASMQPSLDRSLLVCGALLHDAGKIEEYEAGSLTIEMTTRGRLLGHIMIGKDMVDERIRTITGFPAELHLELAHMILSHHGQKEWGSPEIPRTFNAFALFHADLVSARLNQFALAAGKGNRGDGWTDWDRLLERDIYLGLAE